MGKSAATLTEWPHRAALVGCGLTAAVLLAEVLLRLAGIAYPVFSRPDDERGWALRPGARGHYGVEGASWVEINRDGRRDRERPPTKPPGTFRIALLGDSYAEALGVPVEQTFWAVLERKWADAARGRERGADAAAEHGTPPPGSPPVELLNFGVHGYGTAQELLTLRCCVWDYAPDVVLLAFFAGNDVSDNSPFLDRSPTRYARPYVAPTPAEWTVDRSFRRSWRYRAGRLLAPLVAHSRVLQLGNRAHNVRLRRRAATPATGETAIDREIGLDAGVFRDPPDGAWADAWRTTEELVAAMARETRSRGARFGVVFIPAPIQVYPDSAVRLRFARALGTADLSHPARRIAALGRRQGFPVLDLTPGLEAYAGAHGRFLHGSAGTAPGVGHWNPLGHRLAGEAIARWLAEWVGAPPS